MQGDIVLGVGAFIPNKCAANSSHLLHFIPGVALGFITGTLIGCIRTSSESQSGIVISILREQTKRLTRQSAKLLAGLQICVGRLKFHLLFIANFSVKLSIHCLSLLWIRHSLLVITIFHYKYL